MFICTNPMKPGVKPVNKTVAVAEPIFAVTTDVAFTNVSVGVGTPSPTAGDTGPEPVRYAMIVLPAFAGFPASLRLKSGKFCTIAAPFANAKSPGAAVETGTEIVLL